MDENQSSRSRRLTRRQALGIAGAAGAAYVAGPLTPFGGSNGDGAAQPTNADAAASCVLAPELTEGPYWVDERLKRSDVRAGQSGVELDLSLYVYRADDSCEPEQGAVVDIWHCNAEGLYSDEAVNETSGQTWLRGYQETDSAGLAKFTTIFPGWYSGRTVHIHLRVRTFEGSTRTFNFTSQIFFSQSDIAAVLATSPYSARGTTPDTTNAEDSIYQQGAKSGNNLQPALSGSASSGFSATVGIGLSGLPASSSGLESSDDGVDAKLIGRKLRRSGGRREVALRIDAGERVAANAELLRAGKVIAQKRIGALAAGERNLVIPVANGVAAGPARLRLALSDRAGNHKVVRRTLRLPRA
ncbi:MAG TPA: intradiol ring-cleavage dioxygenase [Solirubrobacterales bacterium]|nr:intradiol ring-cleavage dioxygenase [Solirubrobacterales bacterium]